MKHCFILTVKYGTTKLPYITCGLKLALSIIPALDAVRARPVSGSEMDEIISMQSVVKVSKGRLGRSLDREVVILNLQNSTYYGLDPVGAYVWSLMQRATSVRELRDAMLKKYEVDEQRCERELLDLLQTMHSEALIEVQRAQFR